MRYILTIVMAMAYGPSVFAEADFNPDKFNARPASVPTNTGTSATRDGVGTANGSTGTPKQIGAIPGSINPGSNTGQQSQSGGSGANSAIGGALMAAGAAMMSQPPTMPQGAMLMAMGLLAMMQSGEDSGAAGQSAATGAASAVNGTGTGNSTIPQDATGNSAFVDAKIKEGQAKLAAAGYKMTEKGLTKPDGSFVPSSQFNTAGGMAAAGMSPQTIAQAQGILEGADGAASGARVSSVGVASGGGGAGIPEGESNGPSDPGGGAHGNPFNIDGEKKGQLVAGKTIMFDGEPIGVRGQNIFDMVHTCYQKKRQGNHFIEAEHDVATRMPASAGKPR